jgi:hypothetical protein
VASACALAGCPVDNRVLLEGAAFGGQAGSAGSSPEAAAGAASGAAGDRDASDASISEGGSDDMEDASSDAGSLVIPTVGGCADLDLNNVGDCTETLISNADFKTDVASWVADADTTLTWSPQNAAGDSPSGSALVASTGVIDAQAIGAALRAAGQCIPVSGKQLVIAYANAFVDSGQDAQGHAEIDVFFYDVAGCMGTLTSSFSTPQPLDASAGVWLTLRAGAVSPDTTKSALVKIAISKPFRAASFQAHFDDVLVKVKSP